MFVVLRSMKVLSLLVIAIYAKSFILKTEKLVICGSVYKFRKERDIMVEYKFDLGPLGTATYVGDVLGNSKIRHGKGKIILSNMVVMYDGYFENDKFHGKGMLQTPGYQIGKSGSGNKYVGDFQNGEFNGHGTLTGADGDEYVGDFENGAPNGFGKLKYPNGDTYEGHFSNGFFHGEGKYELGGYKHSGTYKNGEKNGQGTLTCPNGDVYEGSYEDDRRRGSGKLTKSDGTIYVGEWRFDDSTEESTVTTQDGHIYAVTPSNGGLEVCLKNQGRQVSKAIAKTKNIPPTFAKQIVGKWENTDWTRTYWIFDANGILKTDQIAGYQVFKGSYSLENSKLTVTHESDDHSFDINIFISGDTLTLELPYSGPHKFVRSNDYGANRSNSQIEQLQARFDKMSIERKKDFVEKLKQIVIKEKDAQELRNFLNRCRFQIGDWGTPSITLPRETEKNQAPFSYKELDEAVKIGTLSIMENAAKRFIKSVNPEMLSLFEQQLNDMPISRRSEELTKLLKGWSKDLQDKEVFENDNVKNLTNPLKILGHTGGEIDGDYVRIVIKKDSSTGTPTGYDNSSSRVYSIKELETLASKGDSDAQCAMGDYHSSEGKSFDPKKANFWYEQAAKQNHPKAQGVMAGSYMNGLSVDKDIVKAEYWARKSAAQNSPTGMFILSHCCIEKNDFSGATYWLECAESLGYPDAKEFLKVIKAFPQ